MVSDHGRGLWEPLLRRRRLVHEAVRPEFVLQLLLRQRDVLLLAGRDLSDGKIENRRRKMSDYRIETKCIQSGWQPENGGPRMLPIYQSTTFKYDTSEHMGKLFGPGRGRIFLYPPAESHQRRRGGEDRGSGGRRGGDADLLRSGGQFLRGIQHLRGGRACDLRFFHLRRHLQSSGSHH